jgi:N-methylhydantoinase B
MRSPDPELFELSSPHLLLEYEYLPDSAGAGEWRGGLGTRSRWRIDGIDELGVTIGDDCACEGAEPAPGLFGGEPAGLNELRLHFPDGTVKEWGSKEIVFGIPPGTVCESLNGGGAGYGDPRRRDPARVLADVRDGLLSPEKARQSYGVAVTGDGDGVDDAETARLRAGRP